MAWSVQAPVLVTAAAIAITAAMHSPAATATPMSGSSPDGSTLAVELTVAQRADPTDEFHVTVTEEETYAGEPAIPGGHSTGNGTTNGDAPAIATFQSNGRNLQADITITSTDLFSDKLSHYDFAGTGCRSGDGSTLSFPAHTASYRTVETESGEEYTAVRIRIQLGSLAFARDDYRCQVAATAKPATVSVQHVLGAHPSWYVTVEPFLGAQVTQGSSLTTRLGQVRLAPEGGKEASDMEAATGRVEVSPGHRVDLGGFYTSDKYDEATRTTDSHRGFVARLECQNSQSSSETVLPTGPGLLGSFVPAEGDHVTCVVTSYPGFKDVASASVFFPEISWLVYSTIAGGYEDGTFRPKDAVSRQAMAAFLYRFAGEPEFDVPTRPSFTDVPARHPFFREIEWLASTGVTTGYEDRTFRPGATVARQAMAAFLYRSAGEPAASVTASPSFRDVPADHAFHREVTWLASAGIAEGYDDGGYHPSTPVARQAMAAFLHRYSALYSE